jgi:hypothetical protein
LVQPFLTVLNLYGKRVAIIGGTAFNHVTNIDIAALETDRVEQLLQELPCLAYERAPLLVFVESRSLSDEHYLGLIGAFSGDCLCASPGELFTIRARS